MKAENIHQRDRIIAKRLRIIKECWGYGQKAKVEYPSRQPLSPEWPPAWLKPNRLHKWNLRCGCPMCRSYRHKLSDYYHQRKQLPMDDNE